MTIENKEQNVVAEESASSQNDVTPDTEKPSESPQNSIQGQSQPDGGGEPDAGAPDKYELTVAEDSRLDASYADEIASFAREQGLSNDVAQALLDRDAALAAGVRDESEVIEEQRTKWIENLKADKEFGGSNYSQTLTLAQRAWERFGPKGVDLGPMGDNDTLLKFAAAVGKIMHDDTLVTGGIKIKPQNKSLAERMYPNQGAN